MSVDLPPLDPRLQAVAVALGVVTATGGQPQLNPAFFRNPMQTAEGLLADASRLDALDTALAGLLPGPQLALPPPVPDAHSASYYGLTPDSPAGGVYLSLTRSAEITGLGLVAEARHTATGAACTVSLPILTAATAAGAVPSFATGDGADPVRVEAAVPVGWAMPARPFALSAVRLTGLLYRPDVTSGTSRLLLTLAGLDLGDGPRDLEFDPQNLTAETADLVTSLLRAALDLAGLPSGDPLSRLAEVLPALLGRMPGAPPLALADLAGDPGLFRDWLGTLTATTLPGTGAGGASNALVSWLSALGQLLGAAPPAAGLDQLPMPGDPLSLVLLTDSAGLPQVELRAAVTPDAATGSPLLQIMVAARIGAAALGLPGTTMAAAQLGAEATLLVLPLHGASPVTVLPQARVFLDSGVPVHPPVAGDPTGLAVGRVRAGLALTGAGIAPLLELDDVAVSLPGVTPAGWQAPQLALGPGRQLGSDAAALLQTALDGLLGNDATAAALLQLAGLGDPAAFAAFVTDPAAAITAHYRGLLASGQLPQLAAALGQLLGLAVAPSTGPGTPDAPCLLSLGAITGQGPVTADLALWQAPPASASSATGLCLGLRTAVAGSSSAWPWDLSWTATLLGFDLPAAGSAARVAVRLLGQQTLAVTLQLTALAPAPVETSAITVTASWQPGAPLAVSATLRALTVDVSGSPVSLGDVTYPPGPVLDAGTSRGVLAAVARLLGQLADTGGPALGTLAALLGLGVPGTHGLPADWPVLPDLVSGDITALAADPAGAVRAWLGALAAAPPPPGTLRPHLLAALDVLRAVFALPEGPPVTGTGTPADPWRLPLDQAASPALTLLTWLGPDGPPPSWTTPLSAAVQDSAASLGLGPVVTDLGAVIPAAADSLRGLDPGAIQAALTALGNALTGTDGVLPAGLAEPSDPAGWQVLPAPVPSAHHQAPTDPAAVQAVTGWLTALTPRPPVILLVAPGFAPAGVWDPLVAVAQAAGLTGPAVPASLRVPGTPPDLVDLSGLAAARYYLVDLADDGAVDLATLSGRLTAVAGRALQVTGVGRLAVVAHSTAGPVALAWAAAAPGSCLGIATVASPLQPQAAGGGQDDPGWAAPAALTDPVVADGVRLARLLLPNGTGAGPLDATLGLLATALDGPTAAGGSSLADLTAAALSRPAASLPAGIPGLAITAALTDDLASALSAGLLALLTPAAGQTGSPTQLGAALEIALPAGSPAGTDPQVGITLRLDLGTMALSAGAAQAGPAPQLSMQATLSRPDGWLLGGAGDGTPLHARVRSASMRLILPPAGGTATASFGVTLIDAALDGAGGPAVTLDHACGPQLLGALFQSLAATAAPGGQLETLLTLLDGAGLLLRDASGQVTGLAADALAGLRADPVRWLGPRAAALLTGGTAARLGLAPIQVPPGTPARWSYPLTDGWALLLDTSPWQLRIATADGGLALGSGLLLSLDVGASLPGLARSTQASLTLGPATGLRWTPGPAGGSLLLDLPGAPGLQLWPTPAASELTAAAQRLLPRLITSAALTAVLRQLADVPALPSLDGLLADAGGWLTRAGALGGSSGPDPAAVSRLLQAVADLTGLNDGADGIAVLPGLSLSAAPAAAQTGLRLTLATTGAGLQPAGPDGPAIALSCTAVLTPGHPVTVSGSLSADVPLPAGTWGRQVLAVTLASDGSLTITVTPHGGSQVTLYPQVQGVAELIVGAVEDLLPHLLDAIVEALSAPTASPALVAILQVASALEVYLPPGQAAAGAPSGFTARQDQLRQLVQAWPAAAGLNAALASLLGTAATGKDGMPALTLTLPGGGELAVAGGAVSGGAAFQVSLADASLGPVTGNLSVTAGTAGPAVVSATLSVDLSAALGFPCHPSLSLSGGSAQPLALSLALAEGGPAVQLAPSPRIDAGAAASLAGLAGPALLALAVDFLRSKSLLEVSPWPNGPRLDALLHAAGLLSADGKVASLLPSPEQLAAGLLEQGLAAQSIPLPGGMTLATATDQNRSGLTLSGGVVLSADDLTATLLAGSLAGTAVAGQGAGITAWLVDTGSQVSVDLGVSLSDVGIRLGRASGSLVDTAVVTLDALTVGLAAAQLSGQGISGISGLLALEGAGLPLLGSVGGDASPPDPVLTGMVSPAQGGGSPLNPPVDLTVTWSQSGLTVSLDGTDSPDPHWVVVAKDFGPLHVQQIGLSHPKGDQVAVAVDASVSVSGLTVAADGLTVTIPLSSLTSPGTWTAGLHGLAVTLSQPGVLVTGGMTRTTVGNAVEYDGTLAIEVAGRGFQAVGGYAQEQDSAGGYTSLFIFVSLGFPLGGPPAFFVEGLAGGVGYNRRLQVPQDPASVPSFPLVVAINPGPNGLSLADELGELSGSLPARRGSYWVAAGARITSFDLLHTTAVAYAALDGGLTIGLLGVTRLTLPMYPVPPLVNVELAVDARYSTADGTLSILGQLTDNSWLISTDCQLTGGFAVVLWFEQHRFVATIGGYAPWFDATGYPAVPRVGLSWAVSDTVSVKGESYFALVPATVMFGGRIEASYTTDVVDVWFTAWLDVLICWDPLAYRLEAGISIGASFNVSALFATVTITVSLGASVVLEGPPLHGLVAVDLDVAKVTVEIGEAPPARQYLLWSGFESRYLDHGLTVGTARVVAGMAPPGAYPTDAQNGQTGSPDGLTPASAMPVLPSWQLRTESRLPVMTASWQGSPVELPVPAGVPALPSALLTVPCGILSPLVTVSHAVTVTAVDGSGNPVSSPALPPLDAGVTVTPRWTGYSAALYQAPAEQNAQQVAGDGFIAPGGFDVAFAPVLTPPAASIALSMEFATATNTLPPSPPSAVAAQAVGPVAASAAPTGRSAPASHAPASPAPAARYRAAVNLRSGHVTRQPPTLTADGAAAPPAGSAAVWDIGPPSHALAPGITGAARLTCLSGAGHVLSDTPDAGASTGVLPSETATVVVTPVPSGVARMPAVPAGPTVLGGWRSGTGLLHVAPATALCAGGVVLVPGLSARRPPRMVPARSFLRAWRACQTMLPAASVVVAVYLEPEPGRAPQGTGDLIVSLDSRPATRVLVPTAAGAVLLLKLDDGPPAGRLSVSAASARDWRLAGVIGLAASPAVWDGRLGLLTAPGLASPPGAGIATAPTEPVTVRWPVTGMSAGTEPR